MCNLKILYMPGSNAVFRKSSNCVYCPLCDLYILFFLVVDGGCDEDIGIRDAVIVLVVV